MTPRSPDARYDDILRAAGYAREIVRRGRHEFDWRSDPELIWTALAEDVREVERMVIDVT